MRDVQIQDIKTLQKFSSVHASIHNHFDLDRHLNHREVFKQNRSNTLAEWYQLAARTLPFFGTL
jgi:putative transposase